jgi:GTP-binding protein Era
MVDVAAEALKDADLILWLLEASAPPTAADRHIAETVQNLRGDTPVILALNKVDQIQGETNFDDYTALIEHNQAIPVSALDGTNIDTLLAELLSQLPLGPRYYPADQVSEVNLRFIAAETIREKIILNTEQEIPHSVAVEIDSYKDRDENLTYISAIIYVERDSQKGIIIGKRGQMIKRLGTEAREELSEIIGTKVYLDLRVKVLRNWRSNKGFMRRLGYRFPKKKS